MPGLIGMPVFAGARRALVAAAAAAALSAAAGEELEVPPGFVARPSRLQKGFPSVGAFQKVPGRRLQADGGRPERDLYAAEEGGQRLLYEYASNSTAGQILNTDREESLVAMSCDIPRHAGGRGFLRLLWREGAVPGTNITAAARLPLQPGDAVVGGPAWGCGRVPGEGFSFEVVEVKQVASVADRTTVVLVRPKHPLHFFPDLFMGLTWTGLGERRLTGGSASWNFTPSALGYNVDENGNAYMRNIDIGYLRCSDCTASLQPTITFTLRTTGFLPVAASIRINGFLNISLSVGLSNSALDVLEEAWKRISEYFGPELISAAAASAAGGAGSLLLLPLFNQVTDALDIELRPVIGFDTMMKSLRDLFMDSRINLGITTDPANTYFELSWSKEEGMSVNTSFDFDTSFGYSGSTITRDVIAGMRSCLGLQLNVLNAQDPFTKLEVCPELKAFARSTTDTSAVPLYPAELEATSATPDARLCFEFKSFTTDVNLDFNHDDPYLEGCFLGKCANSGIGSFQGETATFPDGQKCIDIVRSDLEVADICLHAHEDDTFYSQQYAQPLFVRLTSTKCPNLNCELNEILVPKGGSKAQMRVKVLVSNLRRLQSTPSASSCRGTALGVSMGVSGSFGGFHYPSYFSHGQDDQAIHPGGRMPARRPLQPRLLCQEHTYGYASVALAHRGAMVLGAVPAVIAALALTGRQGFMA